MVSQVLGESTPVGENLVGQISRQRLEFSGSKIYKDKIYKNIIHVIKHIDIPLRARNYQWWSSGQDGDMVDGGHLGQ